MHRMAVVLAMLAAAAPLAAQEPQCDVPLSPDATAACNTAVDGVRAFYPLAGVIVSGGNPELGKGGTLGGFGHFALTVRVTGTEASLPDPTAGNQSPVPSSFTGTIPAPTVEGAMGLVKGAGSGLLAIDLLGSALVLPTRIENLTVDSNATHISDAALGFGYGVRIGVLKGQSAVPAVSVSWMHRSVPRVRYGTLGPTFGTGDDFEFTMDLEANNFRAVAGWTLSSVDIAAGFGVDRYSSKDTNIRFHDNPTNPTNVRTVVINPTNTRALVFANAGLSLAGVKLVGEIGLQAGTDQSSYTDFSDFDPKAGHVFGGIGVRFGF